MSLKISKTWVSRGYAEEVSIGDHITLYNVGQQEIVSGKVVDLYTHTPTPKMGRDDWNMAKIETENGIIEKILGLVKKMSSILA